MSELLQKSHFDPYLNEVFKVDLGESRFWDLELIEIEDRSTIATEGFSLIFKGSKEGVLSQMIHNFVHPKMGRFEMFIVPITYPKRTDGIFYQAIFNRLKSNT